MNNQITIYLFCWFDKLNKQFLKDSFYWECDLYRNVKLSEFYQVDKKIFVILRNNWKFDFLSYKRNWVWSKVEDFTNLIRSIEENNFFKNFIDRTFSNTSLYNEYWKYIQDKSINSCEINLLVEKENFTKKDLEELKWKLEEFTKNIIINTWFDTKQFKNELLYFNNQFQKLHEFQKMIFCWENTYSLETLFENIIDEQEFRNELTFCEHMYDRWLAKDYEYDEKDNLWKFVDKFEFIHDDKFIYLIFQDFIVKYYNNFSHKKFDIYLTHSSFTYWLESSYLESILKLLNQFYKEHIKEKNTENFYKELYNFLIIHPELSDEFDKINEKDIKVLVNYFKKRINKYTKRIEKLYNSKYNSIPNSLVQD